MGAKIGEYEVIDKLGQGNMGVVYLARSEVSDVLVAVKVISPEISEDQKFVQRFLREMHVVSQLKHPHIVDALDFGVDLEKNLYFVALEFVDGESLKDLLDREKGLPLGRALKITRRIAEGLQYASEQRVIHRDIKPENILLGVNGDVKLSDFGLGKSDELTNITQQGVILGTPYYMAPEQADSHKTMDIRGDIYSLGATLFHMLTGRPPFLKNSAVALLVAHCQESFPSLGGFIPGIPSSVDDLLGKMTAKNREDRFLNPQELAQAIQRLEIQLGDALHLSCPASDPEETRAALSLTLSGTISILKGNTELVGFSELIQSVYASGRTGALIFSEGGKGTRIYFAGGKITHAEKGSLRGNEAFIEILKTIQGQFAFREGETTLVSTVEQNTMELLMEGLRVLDEQGSAPRRPSRQSPHKSHTSMIGKLDPITPLEIVNQIFSQRKTGVLSLNRIEESGEIYFLDGQIIEAEAETLKGEDAFFKMILWNQGLFRFREDEPTLEKRITRDTLALLMDGDHMIEEKKSRVSPEPAKEIGLDQVLGSEES